MKRLMQRSALLVCSLLVSLQPCIAAGAASECAPRANIAHARHSSTPVTRLAQLSTEGSAQRSTLPPITIALDATEAPRKILHARLTIPAKPGQLTLYYPKWIPGEHGPTGPITDLAGLKITAAGKTTPWRRDDVDMYATSTCRPEQRRWKSLSIFCFLKRVVFRRPHLPPRIWPFSVGIRYCFTRRVTVLTTWPTKLLCICQPGGNMAVHCPWCQLLV